LDNIKWLFNNDFYYDSRVFGAAITNGNVKNLDWLLEKKFPYYNNIFEIALSNERLPVMKWIIEKKLEINLNIEMPKKYFKIINRRSKKYKIKMEIMNWLISNKIHIRNFYNIVLYVNDMTKRNVTKKKRKLEN